MNPQRLFRTFAVFTLLIGLGLSTVPVSPAGASTQDGTTAALTDDSPSAQITRLYEAFFLRTPPDADRQFWVGELNSSRHNLASIAEFFASGTEFQNTYGTLSNTQFVDLIYTNVLGRARAASETFWIEELDASNRTRGGVMIGFSESAEFRTALLARYDDSAVFRLYCAYFLRQPDAGGREFWKTQAANGMPLKDISDAFAGSPEFDTLYGSLNGVGFVNLIYTNLLDRRPDQGGLNFWSGEIDSGNRTRGDVMIGFSEAPEYVGRFPANGGCPSNGSTPTGPTTPTPPVANDDTATTNPGVKVVIPVTVNDTLSGSAITITTAPTSGTAVVVGNTIEYTPAGATNDTLVYTLTNADGADTATVSIVINAAGSPAAVGDSAVSAKGNATPVVIDVTGNDVVAGGALTITSAPQNELGVQSGAATIVNGNQISFQPTPGNAWDEMTIGYTLTNGIGASSATVTVTNCEVFVTPPTISDGTTPAVDFVKFFMKSRSCYEPYNSSSGPLTLTWTNVTINGVAKTAVPQAGVPQEARVATNPADYANGAAVQIIGTLTVTNSAGTVLLTNEGFLANYRAEANAGQPWPGVNGTQNAIGVINPFTGQ